MKEIIGLLQNNISTIIVGIVIIVLVVLAVVKIRNNKGKCESGQCSEYCSGCGEQRMCTDFKKNENETEK